MNYEYYLGELNGYLKALSRGCGWRYVFGVTFSLESLSLDEFLESEVAKRKQYREETYLGYKKIEYDNLLSQIELMVFSGKFRKKEGCEKAQANFFNAIMEDVHDYFGLLATARSQDASFYPLIKNPVYKVDITSPSFGKSFFFALEVEGAYLLTYFYEKFHQKK